MALTATIFKAELQIADLDRSYYADHHLTLARHPSETDERMMMRLLAFVLHAGERLEFTRGLCADDEPDLWARDLTGDIDLWIDVGQPDARRIRKACQRAAKVRVYAFGGHAAELWWRRSVDEVKRFKNLQVEHVPPEATKSLAGLARRTMRLQCTVQEEQVWIGDSQDTVLLSPEQWYG